MFHLNDVPEDERSSRFLFGNHYLLFYILIHPYLFIIFQCPFFWVEFQVEGHVPLKYVLHARLDSRYADGFGLQEQDHCVERANGCFRDEGGEAPIACLSWLGISPFFLGRLSPSKDFWDR